MAQAAHHHFTFDEYLTLEDDSGTKHEFLGGQVWAMSGGSPEHAAVTMNVGALLSNAPRGQPCRTYSSDLRVRVQATGLGTYPDVTVICGHLELDPHDPKKHTALNPRVLVEVLSPSTEDYDRGESWATTRRFQRSPRSCSSRTIAARSRLSAGSPMEAGPARSRGRARSHV